MDSKNPELESRVAQTPRNILDQPPLQKHDSMTFSAQNSSRVWLPWVPTCGFSSQPQLDPQSVVSRLDGLQGLMPLFGCVLQPARSGCWVVGASYNTQDWTIYSTLYTWVIQWVPNGGLYSSSVVDTPNRMILILVYIGVVEKFGFRDRS